VLSQAALAGEPLGGRTQWRIEPSGRDALETPVEAQLPESAKIVEVSLLCSPDEDTPADGSARAAGDCNPDDAVPLHVRGIEVTLREDLPPEGTTVGGTLLSDQPASGTRSLEYSASDQESGLARIEVLVDETVVATRDLAGRCAYTDFTACPTTDRDSLSVDTRGFTDGRHALTLRVIDAAGNRRDEPTRIIEVRNSAGPSATVGLAPVAGAQLSADFVRTSRSTLIVAFAERVSLRGWLTTASREGIANARIDVFERTAGSGAREVAVGSAVTRADGRFSYTLAPRRASRSVRLAYGPMVSARPLRVRVRAASTLKATLRGTLLRFSGRVLSQPLRAIGKQVRLEGVSTGFKWRRFATLRTDRDGRFSGRFRLAGRRPGARYYMRVRVPAERGYPYLAATGRPIRLRAR
jgi:hypothetical protein